jgi:hypothetical protein
VRLRAYLVPFGLFPSNYSTKLGHYPPLPVVDMIVEVDRAVARRTVMETRLYLCGGDPARWRGSQRRA